MMMFRKLKSGIAGVSAGAVSVGLSAAPALATDNWYDSISVDTTAVTTIFGGIAGALATIWGIRKVISLLNKS